MSTASIKVPIVFKVAFKCTCFGDSSDFISASKKSVVSKILRFIERGRSIES